MTHYETKNIFHVDHLYHLFDGYRDLFTPIHHTSDEDRYGRAATISEKIALRSILRQDINPVLIYVVEINMDS